MQQHFVVLCLSLLLAACMYACCLSFKNKERYKETFCGSRSCMYACMHACKTTQSPEVSPRLLLFLFCFVSFRLVCLFSFFSSAETPQHKRTLKEMLGLSHAQMHARMRACMQCMHATRCLHGLFICNSVSAAHLCLLLWRCLLRLRG